MGRGRSWRGDLGGGVLFGIFGSGMRVYLYRTLKFFLSVTCFRDRFFLMVSIRVIMFESKFGGSSGYIKGEVARMGWDGNWVDGGRMGFSVVLSLFVRFREFIALVSYIKFCII